MNYELSHGGEADGEGAVGVGESVLLVGDCAPGVDAAESHHAGVDQEVGVGDGVDFGEVSLDFGVALV